VLVLAFSSTLVFIPVLDISFEILSVLLLSSEILHYFDFTFFFFFLLVYMRNTENSILQSFGVPLLKQPIFITVYSVVYSRDRFDWT